MRMQTVRVGFTGLMTLICFIKSGEFYTSLTRIRHVGPVGEPTAYGSVGALCIILISLFSVAILVWWMVGLASRAFDVAEQQHRQRDQLGIYRSFIIVLVIGDGLYHGNLLPNWLAREFYIFLPLPTAMWFALATGALAGWMANTFLVAVGWNHDKARSDISGGFNFSV